MKIDSVLKMTCLLCVLVCCLVTNGDAAQAWAVQIVSIEIDGKAADKAIEIEVLAPGKDNAEKRTLGVGAKIEQGVLIIVPRRTVLALASANSNQAWLQPGTRFKVNVVSNEGEAYSLLSGKVLLKVSKAMNFFNVDHQRFFAFVRGTEFVMAVEPEKEISFNLIKGRLVVQREVKVKILEEYKVAQLKASEVLEQGKKTQVSYRLGVEEYLKEFKTFKDAEQYFRQQLEADEKSGEYERVQWGRNELGNILVTLGKCREGIEYYKRALEAAHERRDQYKNGSLLQNLGDAHYCLGEYHKAIEYYKKGLAVGFEINPDGVNRFTAVSYIGLGNAYISLRQPDEALKYLKKVLALSEEMTDTDFACARFGMGMAFDELGFTVLAISYYEGSLALLYRLYPDGLYSGIATGLNTLGTAYGRIGQHGMAIIYFKKSLSLMLKFYPSGVHPDIVGCYRNLSKAWRNARDPVRSEWYAKKAKEIEGKMKR